MDRKFVTGFTGVWSMLFIGCDRSLGLSGQHGRFATTDPVTRAEARLRDELARCAVCLFVPLDGLFDAPDNIIFRRKAEVLNGVADVGA